MYPSKILLFGEYSILLKSTALSIPFKMFNGELATMETEDSEKSDEQAGSNQILKEFLGFLNKESTKNSIPYHFDFEAFEKDIMNGLYFRSDIPESSGLGSSGALVASVFDRYTNILKSEKDHKKIRGCLGLFESFFHGNSSGIDPLTSYLKVPVLIKNNEISVSFGFKVEESVQKSGLFLVHSNQKGNTGILVKNFDKRCKGDSRYLSAVLERYIPLNDYCTMSLTNMYDEFSFFPAIRKLTTLQLELFDDMIPLTLLPLAEYGLSNDLFYLKLCGSGGGGYFLGFTKNLKSTENYFNSKGYQILPFGSAQGSAKSLILKSPYIP
jgi:mevalonate kinase